MPEGDTVWRSAARLATALVGRELTFFQATRLVGTRPRVGDTLEEVRANGKHLLMSFSGGLTLDTHLRMTGSWHLYRVGERWRKPAHLLRVRVDVDGWQAVGFSVPMVRTFPTAQLVANRSPVAHLGPDLCAVGVDIDECLERMRSLPLHDRLLKEVLLDQRVANGVGNVYASEVCWAERLNPALRFDMVDDADRRRLLVTAAKLLQANLGAGPRITVPGGLAVYGRRNRGCRRCGTPIRERKLGEHARVTFWCPTCQPLDRDTPP